MSTASEINLKAKVAWPIVDSLREKFAQALNEQIDNALRTSWSPGRYFSSGAQLKGKIKPLAHRAGPRGRRLALKVRRVGWLPRVFGVDWGRPEGDASVLMIRQGPKVILVAQIDKPAFKP